MPGKGIYSFYEPEEYNNKLRMVLYFVYKTAVFHPAAKIGKSVHQSGQLADIFYFFQIQDGSDNPVTL